MTTWDALITSRPPKGADLNKLVEGMIEALQTKAGVDVWTTAGDPNGTISAHFGLMVPSDATFEEVFREAQKVFLEAAMATGWIPLSGEATVNDPVRLVGIELHVLGEMGAPETALAV